MVYYGLEICHLPTSMLKELNTRQNILIKNSIGLSKYVRTKPLMQALKIKSMEELYYKHKLLFIEQLRKNEMSNYLLEFLSKSYVDVKINRESYFYDLQIALKLINGSLEKYHKKQYVEKLEEYFKCKDDEVVSFVRLALENLESRMGILVYQKRLEELHLLLSQHEDTVTLNLD